MFKFKNNQRVVIHSLGPSHEGKEYHAVIRGIASELVPIYIVEAIDILDAEYPYDCYTVPECCIRLLED